MSVLPIITEDNEKLHESVSGAGPFSFDFGYGSHQDITCYVDGEKITGFTVWGTDADVGFDGGNIYLNTPLSGQDLLIRRDTRRLRESVFGPGGAGPLGVDTELHRLTWMAQDNHSYVDRVLAAVSDAQLAEVIAGLSGKIDKLSSIDALRSATATSGAVAYIAGRWFAGDGGHGHFRWVTGDRSAEVANDPARIIWVSSASDPTGAGGAWRRIGAGWGKINVLWAGAQASTAVAADYYDDLAAVQAAYPHALSTGDYLDWLATQAVLKAYPGRLVYFPGNTGIYRWNRGVKVFDANGGIIGDGPGQTHIYSSATDTALYCGPEDYEATASLSRPKLHGFRMSNIVADPTNIGIEMRQCFSSEISHVHMFGFQKSCLLAGGTNHQIDFVDWRSDPTDAPASGSYVLKVVSSDRGANGWQPCYGVELGKHYFSGDDGSLEAIVIIGIGDGLHMSNGYWKSGIRGLVFEPDAGDFGIRADFTAVYIDGTTETVSNFEVPAFDQAGNSVGGVTFTGGHIANALSGSNIVVKDPANGGVNFITFNGTVISGSRDEAVSVTNTDRDLHFELANCTVRDCGGGVSIDSIGSFKMLGGTMEDISNASGVAHFKLRGTMDAFTVDNVHTKRRASNDAALLDNTATIQRYALSPRNSDSANRRSLRYPQIVLGNNTATSIPMDVPASGFGMVMINSYSGVGFGIVRFRSDGITNLIGGALSVVNNTVLEGTTGAGSAVTVSYRSSDERLYIENRSGAPLTLEFDIMN